MKSLGLDIISSLTNKVITSSLTSLVGVAAAGGAGIKVHFSVFLLFVIGFSNTIA